MWFSVGGEKKELRSMGFPSVMTEMFRNDTVAMVTQHCE